MGEQAQGHMVMPAPPAAHGIVIHPDLTLALLDRVFDRPATGSQACEGGGGRGTRCVGEVGLERSVLISAAPQDEPHLRTRQAVTHRHDSSPGGELSLPQGVQLGVSTWGDGGTSEIRLLEGYRELVSKGQQRTVLTGHIQAPVPVSAQFIIRVLAPRHRGERFAFKVQIQESDEVFDIRLHDVHPEYSAVFRLRLNAWVRLVINLLLTRLRLDVETALRDKGYSSSTERA